MADVIISFFCQSNPCVFTCTSRWFDSNCERTQTEVTRFCSNCVIRSLTSHPTQCTLFSHSTCLANTVLKNKDTHTEAGEADRGALTPWRIILLQLSVGNVGIMMRAVSSAGSGASSLPSAALNAAARTVRGFALQGLTLSLLKLSHTLCSRASPALSRSRRSHHGSVCLTLRSFS